MRTWTLPAEVDTDQLAPGPTMKFGLDVTARHCLETVRPDFATGVRPGDVLVAGRDFGIGSRNVTTRHSGPSRVPQSSAALRAAAATAVRHASNLARCPFVLPSSMTIRSPRLTADFEPCGAGLPDTISVTSFIRSPPAGRGRAGGRCRT